MSNTANKPNYRFNNQDQIQFKDNKEKWSSCKNND